MKNLGIKRKDLYGDEPAMCSPVPKDDENPIVYPSLYLEPKFLKKMGLEDFEPGDRIKVEIEIVVREQTIRKNEKGKETISQCLDLCGSGTPELAGKGEPEDSEDEEDGPDLGYDRSDKKPRKVSAKEALGD